MSSGQVQKRTRTRTQRVREEPVEPPSPAVRAVRQSQAANAVPARKRPPFESLLLKHILGLGFGLALMIAGSFFGSGDFVDTEPATEASIAVQERLAFCQRTVVTTTLHIGARLLLHAWRRHLPDESARLRFVLLSHVSWCTQWLLFRSHTHPLWFERRFDLLLISPGSPSFRNLRWPSTMLGRRFDLLLISPRSPSFHDLR